MYIYDSRGNRTQKRYYDSSSWHTTAYYYTSGNELWSIYEYGTWKSWLLEYDLRGNLTKKYDEAEYDEDEETYNVYTDYFWSSRDLLTKMHIYDGNESIDTTVEYKYDLMGRRAAKRVDYGDGYGWTPWRWYFYDGLKVIAEGRGTSDKTFYTNGPSAIGGIICRDKNETKYWYHYDRLGNVVGVTYANGNAMALYTMDAFGNVLEMTNGADFANERSTDVQPYHLTTKEHDADTGLYYFNARWYDLLTGRFISGDPLASPHENRYPLVESNPVNSVDPTGLIIGGELIETSWRFVINCGTRIVAGICGSIVVYAAVGVITAYILLRLWWWFGERAHEKRWNAMRVGAACAPEAAI